MKLVLGLLMMAIVTQALAEAPSQILADNTRATVYIEIRDAQNRVVDMGSGMVVSQDGYIVTVQHLKADPTQRAQAILGQRDGTSFQLTLRDADEASDTALWQLPQSAMCRSSVVLSLASVKPLDRVVVLGFPDKDGLTPATVSINNVHGAHGFYKADGLLRSGNSGGPVFNEDGKVIGLVEGGGLPGTANNDIVPIAAAVSLINKYHVAAGVETPVPFQNSCYASCRDPSHGVERWTSVTPWSKNSGMISGGHNRPDECKTMIAAELAGQPAGSKIELYPGDQGMSESSSKDIFGHVDYTYYCNGTLKVGPVYVKKQSAACGLWN